MNKCTIPEDADFFTALSEAQKEVKDPKRESSVTVTTKKGGKYGFKYATFNQALDIFREVFCNHGFSFTQGCAMVDNMLCVETVLMHKSGGYMTTYWPVSGFSKDEPQVAGSAFTYAKRYALFAALGINGDDDEDGNVASGNKFEKKKPEGSKLKDPYDALYLKENWYIELPDDTNDEDFLKEFFKYSKRAKDGGEVVKLVDDNLDRLGLMDNDLKSRFLVRLDKEFDDIDDGTGLPNEIRNVIAPQD